jgi:hypothetical protein
MKSTAKRLLFPLKISETVEMKVISLLPFHKNVVLAR